MATTVLNNKQSTYGSPYAFYTLEMSYSDRTATSVKISYTLTAKLQYSESYLGSGHTLKATIYAGGNSTTKTLLSSSSTWSGTTAHTFTGSFTVSGLSVETTSISTALYVQSTYSGNSAQLKKTSGSNLTISTPTKYTISYNANGGSGAPSKQTKYQGVTLKLSNTKPTRSGYQFLGWATSSSATSATYSAGGSYTSNSSATLYAVWKVVNGVSTISLNDFDVFLGDTLQVTLNKLNSGNTTTLTWSSGSHNLTSHTKANDTTFAYDLTNNRFGSWFNNTDNFIDIKITATTYNSSGTSLGTDSESFSLILPEEIGKPDTPTVSIAEQNYQQITLKLVKPNCKNNANFDHWDVNCNVGDVYIEDDIAYIALDETQNVTVIATIYAVDSRGYRSDGVEMVLQKRKKNSVIYRNGNWVSAIPYVYFNGKWAPMSYYLYQNSQWMQYIT